MAGFWHATGMSEVLFEALALVAEQRVRKGALVPSE